MWTRPSDRGEVQEHHCERREPGFEEEDQWANTGETEYTLQHVSEFCMRRFSYFSLLVYNTLLFFLSAGQPAVKTGSDEVSDQSGLTAQWDGLAKDGANRSKHELWTVNTL